MHHWPEQGEEKVRSEDEFETGMLLQPVISSHFFRRYTCQYSELLITAQDYGTQTPSDSIPQQRN